jgi:bifunctional enzyme CysN/CysC
MGNIIERMTVVTVGHVDHGKSTVIGRLLADIGALPQGKLEEVKERCRKNARPFEYAFLLDALKDEQAQGITIDSARIFFNTKKRHYLIFDAPGHIEFLKNMITGAAQAEAALLVIDSHEGIRENSRRHGYLLSMLGVNQVAVVVNKMDLVGYSEDVFNKIKSEYAAFLGNLGITSAAFIPVCAREGENLSRHSDAMSWYKGPTVLEQIDAFKPKAAMPDLPFRFPIQDIYKFTEEGDERRIVAGTVQSGSVKTGDEVIFLPSGKRSTVASVEEFNVPVQKRAEAGKAVGFTLSTQVYIKPGDLMVKAGEAQPKISNRFRANIFWMGKAPLIKGKSYKLKIASARVGVQVEEIVSVIDALGLAGLGKKNQIDMYDVAEIIFETAKPIAFDLASELENTGRFALVDDYEISAGGVILEALKQDDILIRGHIKAREFAWVRGLSSDSRSIHYRHKPAIVFIIGPNNTGKVRIAQTVEEHLVSKGLAAYYLGISNVISGLSSDVVPASDSRDEHIRRLGELSRIMYDAGLIFIATVSDMEAYEAKILTDLCFPAKPIIIAMSGASEVEKPDLVLRPGEPEAEAAGRIFKLLNENGLIDVWPLFPSI